MFKVFVSLLVAILAFNAQASNYTDEVVSYVEGDFDGDGERDYAALTPLGGESGLLSLGVSLSKGGDLFVEQAIYDNNSDWAGVGTELQVSEAGSLQIYSYNEAIGRNRWNQTVTFAYRNGQYMLAGYTYSYYDTLELDNFGSCDLNFLSGKGYVGFEDSKEQISVPRLKYKFTDVNDRLLEKLQSQYCAM